jgi:hypothetical protein
MAAASRRKSRLKRGDLKRRDLKRGEKKCPDSWICWDNPRLELPPVS